MSEVWKCDVSGPLQTVLMALADHADDDGRQVYPSVPYISWKTGYSARQVQRVMARLRKLEALKVVREAKWHKPTEYILVLAVLPKKKSWEEIRDDKMASLAKSASMNPAAFKAGYDNMSPQTKLRQEISGENRNRGDVQSGLRGDTEKIGVTSETVRGDTAMSRRGDIAMSYEPSLTIIEPSGEEEGVESAARPLARPLARATAVSVSGFEDPAWSGQDDWLREFLKTQTHVTAFPLPYFADNAWWSNASVSCHGITPPFIERVFAALGNHLKAKPQRRPMNKAGWLQKMTNFLRIEREIVNREQAKAERERGPRRVAYGR